MTADELKSMNKGSFIVMKTGTHPFISKLKFFFKWGIDYNCEPYSVGDKGARKVEYTNRDIIENEILKKFPHFVVSQKRHPRQHQSQVTLRKWHNLSAQKVRLRKL